MALLVTQHVLEVVATNPTGPVRVTQGVIEVLGQAASADRQARITQHVIEVLAGVPLPQLRSTQHVLEILVRYSTSRGWAFAQIIE